MNKELEALDRLISYDKESRGVRSYETGYVNGKIRTLEDVIKDIKLVQTALTPPTAEKVCEELELVNKIWNNLEEHKEILMQKGIDISFMYDDFNKLKQALTPPNLNDLRDEIIKEYNEYFKSLGGSPTVYYHNNGFYDDEGLLVEVCNDIITWCDDVENNLPLNLAHKITTYFKLLSGVSK